MANESTTGPEIRAGHIEPMRAEQIRLGKAVATGVALKDVRCGKCQKLLFRGELRGEIKCRGCGHMNRWG